jgi:hypothetical protein
MTQFPQREQSRVTGCLRGIQDHDTLEGMELFLLILVADAAQHCEGLISTPVAVLSEGEAIRTCLLGLTVVPAVSGIYSHGKQRAHHTRIPTSALL